MTSARRADPAPARPTRKVGRAQPRGDRTRTRSFHETVRCINEEGFAAASANHIAERAVLTWGVIQYTSVTATGSCPRSSPTVPAPTPWHRVPSVLTDRRASGYEAVVDAAWAAFSSPESRASFESSSRPGRRDQVRVDELEEMARDLRSLSGLLFGNRVDLGGQDAVIGEVLWATLRAW